MQEELKNNLINVLEIRDLIAKKYDQLTLENDNDCKDFLTLINSTLGKTFGYDFIHLFHIKKHKINATFTQLKSVKFNQKSIQNINVFDLELSQFKKGNIIYINQLNQHELTRNQTGITFEHHNTKAAVDVPLYKLNDIEGINRFEAHEEIFSERFFFYLT
ncbi:MAG: hypothetical protein RBT45_01565, partial [Acholeplasmataceae bacterium]|nr:hypothetical protein [Acholeplasmataceae bacterium]